MQNKEEKNRFGGAKLCWYIYQRRLRNHIVAVNIFDNAFLMPQVPIAVSENHRLVLNIII